MICMKLINRLTKEVVLTIDENNKIEILNNEDYELIDNTVRKTHSCELVMDVLDSDEFLYDNKDHQLTYDDGRLV